MGSTGQSAQTACATGTYQPSTGQSACLDADAGHYVASTGQSDQTACSAGAYQPSTGQSACLDADAGHYVPTTGQSAQTPCAAGTYNPDIGSSDASACLDADAGHYVGSTGQSAQTPCAAGTYNPDIGSSDASACLDADAGHYVGSTGQSAQTACSAGAYQPSTGQFACLDADVGHFVKQPVTPSVAIASSSSYPISCSVLQNGSVYCWGDNSRNSYLGALGSGDLSNVDILTPVILPSGSIPIELSVNHDSTSCVLMVNGSAYCWGENNYGQIGDMTTNDGSVPRLVSVLPDGVLIKSIAPSGAHTCAVIENGSVYCWGLSSNGRLGAGDYDGDGEPDPPTNQRPIALYNQTCLTTHMHQR